jgi:fructokinase
MSDTALVVGEALIDVVEHQGQALGEHVGGSPLNVAVGLALLGRQVEFLTWIGGDRRGQRIADYLHDSGVHIAAGSTGAPRTATALAELDESGSATYTFDVDWQIPASVSPASPQVLHTGSIATALEPGASSVEQLVAEHHAVATITFDPNIRPMFFESPEQARSRVEAVVARSDVVKASDEDMRWLEPELSPTDLAARWLSLGPAIVAVTFGADGSYATGLIDALWDAGLLGADRRDQLRDIPADTLRRVVQIAALSSALTVARPGAALPDRATRDRAARRLGVD